MSDIGRVVMVAEIDGKPYLIALPQDRLKLLVKMAEGLSDTGKLPVKHMPDYTFTEIATHATK